MGQVPDQNVARNRLDYLKHIALHHMSVRNILPEKSEEPTVKLHQSKAPRPGGVISRRSRYPLQAPPRCPSGASLRRPPASTTSSWIPECRVGLGGDLIVARSHTVASFKVAVSIPTCSRNAEGTLGRGA